MSLGKDLANIRKEQNLTLEDIQHEVKMSLDTLQSIEDDTIFDRDESQITYTRSFVRSYAKALKIPEEHIVAALDAVEVGIYHKGILMGETVDMPELPPEKDEEEKPAAPIATEGSSKESTSSSPAASSPEVDQINWADMGRRFNPGARNPRMWMLASILVLVIVVISLAWIYRDSIANIFAASEDPVEQVEQPEAPDEDAAAVDTTITEDQPADDLQQESTENDRNLSGLPDTLSVAVYAANGQLEPVRIISDFNWKTNPFWMEEGEAYGFDFRDTLLVRGQYSRMLLLYEGHLIENARMNYFNDEFDAIMITRSILSDPRYQTAPPDSFPLEVGPPDSIEYVIRF